MFVRHHLAIAIAVVLANPAFAETISVDGNNPLLVAGTHTEPATLSGNVVTSSQLLDGWVSLTGIFQSSVTNTASITVNGPATGSISGNGALYIEAQNGAPSEIWGDFIQTGTLRASNINDATVYVGGVSISGKFSNQGTIAQSNTLGALAPSYPNLNVVIDNATLGGGFENSGVIHSQGDDFENLTIENSRIASFKNTGTISADGARSVALLFGAGNRYINTTDNVLYNLGTISAKGADSVGLKNISSLGIENAGTIQADGIGVDISQSDIIYTQVAGLTAGGQAALLGNSSTGQDGTLIAFEGGAVRGDIRSVWVTEVEGDVTMDSALIESRYLELGSGRLTLLRPHTTLSGDLELIGSELELTLSHATDQNRPVLSVGGLAEVEPGSKILLTPKPNDFSTQGLQKYQLISATRWYQDGQNGQQLPVTANDLSVTSTSALLRVNDHGFDGNTLFANLEAIEGDEAARVVADEGASQSAQNAIGKVSQELGKLSPNDPLFAALANADAKRAATLAEQLYPEINGGVNSAAISQQRLMENAFRRYGMTPLRKPENLGKGGVWVQTLYGDSSQGRRQRVTGFDLDTKGIAIGADLNPAPGMLAGVAYGYMDSNAKSHNHNKTGVHGDALSLYGNYQQGGFFIDGSLTYGWTSNDSKRHIAGTTAKGSYDGNFAGISLMTGYDFPVGQGWILEPRVGTRYSNVSLDSYSEKGSSAALHVDNQRYERGEFGAGARLAGSIPVGQGEWVPEAKLMAWHDLIGDRVSATSAFLVGGDSFEAIGVRQSRESYEAGLGLDYRLGAFSVGAGYRYESSSDFDGQSVEGRLRYAF